MESWTIAGLLLLSVLLLQTRACVVAPRKECIHFTPESFPNQKKNYEYSLSPSPLLLSSQPESVWALHGATVSFTCSIGTPPIIINGSLHTFPISWRFNSSSLPVGGLYPQHWSVEGVQANTSTLTVHNISHNDEGYYECMVGDGRTSTGQWASITVSKRAWLNKPLGSGVAPALGLEHQDLHGLKPFDTQFTGECRVTGPNQTLYWYKDGRDVTQYYNGNTGQLIYNNQTDVHGVYQCFVENDAGSDFVNFRALPRFFADPPSNFSCVAVDREGDHLLPSLLVSWGAPPLISSGLHTEQHKYIIKVNNNCYDAGTSTCAEVQLRQDEAVRCSVYLDLDVDVSRMAGSVAAVDNFNTATQRRYSKPRELSINCTSSNVTVRLPAPELPRYVCLQSITLQGVCLHQASVHRTSFEPDPYGPYILDSCESRAITLDVGPQPPGAVCLFGGHYVYDTGEPEDPLIVAPVSCALPSLGDVELSLSCSENETSLRWLGPHPVNVTGLCYTPQLEQVTLEPITLSPGDHFNSSHILPLHSVCMYSTPTNLSAQCVVGRMEEEPSTTDTTNTTSKSTAPSPAPGYVIPVYVWVILSLSTPALLLVAVVMAAMCFTPCYRRYQQSKDKEQMHFLASVVEHQLDNPAYPPVDPFSSVLHGSSLSLQTQVDSLWEETKHASATSLMERFFRESPPQLMIQQYLNTASSSGYGTALTDDETDYYEQGLEEVSECPNNRTRFVREYFEPDLEGYVHMIPYSVR